jgi:hypothetical protein
LGFTAVSRLSKVHASELSEGATKALRKNFAREYKIIVLQETVGANSIPNISLDLAMPIRVPHLIPNNSLAIGDIANKI